MGDQGSSGRRRITATVVERLQNGDQFFDGPLKGFGVRRRSGTISYFVGTRVRGRKVRITIGRHGSPWTPETARKRASELLLEVGSGGDPVARVKAERVRGLTMDEVLTRFMNEYLPKLKPRTQVTYISLIDVNLRPRFGTKLVRELARKDVSAAHAKWGVDQKVTANNAIAVLSKVMTWAEEQEYRDEGSNPCRKVKRFRLSGRERYLDDTEMKRLGEALRRALIEEENPFMVAALALLILTGARKSEVLNLKWSEVDIIRGMGRLEDSKTGRKVLPLSEAALRLIDSLPRLKDHPYVFPGDKPKRPISTVQHVWEQVRTWAELEDVRLHDLRHSFASFAGDAGGSLPLVGKILGHTDPRTTQRYVHFFERTTSGLAGRVGERIAGALGQLEVKPLDVQQQTE